MAKIPVKKPTIMTKRACPKCVSLQVKLKTFDCPEYVLMNGESKDGMAILSYYESLNKTFPILVTPEEDIISGVLNIYRWMRRNAI